jgi:N-acetylglucosaminyldiphosphoundecaprenol N-acetyl-beta-D-mannosaminyltransferase
MLTMNHPPKILGYPVNTLSLAEGLALAEEALRTRRALQVVTLNPEMIMQGEQDPELGQILRTAELVLPDGAGVVWALRRSGYPQVRRLPGIEFSEQLLALADKHQYRVALIGAQQDVLDRAAENLKRRYPGMQLVYTHHGFFNAAQEEQAVLADCIAADPQIVLVALGVPRQEKFIARNRERFQGAVFVGVGGSLDVWSGIKQRAPEIFLRLNLEWLYRITSEPWRIKRTYKSLPLFVVKVLLNRNEPS